jgi:hypothetical protein
MVWNVILPEKMEFWQNKCEGMWLCSTKQCAWFHQVDNSCQIKIRPQAVRLGGERGEGIHYQGTRSGAETLIEEKCRLEVNGEDSSAVNMVNEWGDVQTQINDTDQQ